MGKETKIGLAIIGVLLAVFGVLLFRHLSIGKPTSQWDQENRGPAEPLAAASSPETEQPTVIAAQSDPPSRSDGPLWGSKPEEPAAAPAPTYMPDEAGQPPADRYAADAPPVGASPFQDRQASGASDTAALDPPAELPREDAANQARANPLRRLSAELPLDAPQQAIDETPAAEPGAELVAPSGTGDESGAEAPAADPYADSPAPANEPAPAEAPAPGDIPDAFPEEPLRVPGQDEAEPPREVGSAREPARGAVPGDVGLAAPTAATPRVSVPNGLYTVEPNDTLWSISEKVYGTGGYFKAIAAHNRSRLKRADQLTVGGEIAVPPASELEANYPSLCPKQRRSALVQPRSAAPAQPRRASGGDVYIVEEGDTLFDIARYELGKATRWAEIYDLNREQLGEDFDYLKPGTELRMPARGDAVEAISRGRGGNQYR
jgi:nucleoid-associated protein YgaU